MSFNEDIRNDLHLTSTGTGHQYKSPLLFPPSDFKRSVKTPLPLSLRKSDNVKDFYITTTGSYHDFKPHNPLLQKELFKKAPGHWGVNYVEDTVRKLQVKPQRKALTMGNQSSEMKSEFTGSKGISLNTRFSSDIQPPVYKHHHKDGPLMSLVASTKNPELSGKRYNIQDKGVFNYHGDMYLTTTRKDHRPFTKAEQSKYPKKNYATYWECESYPKAWGHGSQCNPLPPDSVQREKGPMRDSIWFKTPTTIPRIPKPLDPVPHTGMCSEIAANFRDITHSQRKDLFHCPVPSPWKLKTAGKEEIFSVPKMYRTEYQSIASGKPVLV